MTDRKGYTLDEWCALYGISRGTAYKLQHDGKLKIAKLGYKSIITVEEDERFRGQMNESSDDAFKQLSSKRKEAQLRKQKAQKLVESAARIQIGRRK